jgi:hypothetical protein
MRFDDDGAIAVLEVSDVSGQKTLDLENVSAGRTVGELVDQLLAELALVREDTNGRPLTYRARLEREGRHLNAAERLGDALRSGDRLVLQPNIDAGGAKSR